MTSDRVWVLNASPLILLGKAGQLDLLDWPGIELQIPAQVAREVQCGPADNPARLALGA